MMITQMVPRFGRLEMNIGLTKANQGYNQIKPTDQYGVKVVFNEPTDVQDAVVINGKVAGRMLELNTVRTKADAEAFLTKFAAGQVSLDTTDTDRNPTFNTVFTGLGATLRGLVQTPQAMTAAQVFNSRLYQLRKRAELASLATKLGTCENTSPDADSVIFPQMAVGRW